MTLQWAVISLKDSFTCTIDQVIWWTDEGIPKQRRYILFPFANDSGKCNVLKQLYAFLNVKH